MFDGVPADQFHPFIASSRTSLSIPLSFPLHNHHGISIPSPAPAPAPAPAPPVVITPTPTAPAPTFLGCFDPYPSHQTLEVVQPHHHGHHHSTVLHHQLHHQSSPPTATDKNDEEGNLGRDKERSISATIPVDPWTNDEVLALLRIRSSMENWFPEFTWEHVSRKLAELGYQRSADKCKEKFEEESRHFNNMSYTKNYRFFSDLDELYHDDNPQVSSEKNQDLGKEKDKQEEDKIMDLSEQQQDEETENVTNIANPSQENAELEKESMKSKKRKRKYKFEMFKSFCEAVVKRIVAQQEDLHNKLIEDMVRRDEEGIAREEAWKCQEMDRINKEIEMRAQEQVIAGDRQAKIIDLLKKFTSGSQEDQNLIRRIEDLLKVTNRSTTSVTSSSEILPPHPNDTSSSMGNISHHQNPTLLPTSSSETTPSPHNNHYSTTLVHDSTTTPPTTSSSILAMVSGQNPNKNSRKIHENPLFPTPSLAQKQSQKMVSTPNERSDRIAGKRWPRDEVQALINIKCNLTNISTDDNKEAAAAAKGPLWERISQAMQELGYKRSAKRCKEKWENINKYFRKTKDSNKKRSLESRTCPYFHQLSTIYSQGTVVNTSDVPENCPTSPANH